MSEYEKLLDIANGLGLIVIENFNLKINDHLSLSGMIYGKNILLSDTLTTNAERACVLLEEIEHFLNNTGNILDQRFVVNKHQENRARKSCYEKLTPLENIIDAVLKYKYDANVFNVSEILGVTPEFLVKAFSYYGNKYGEYFRTGQYIVVFDPFRVIEKCKF